MSYRSIISAENKDGEQVYVQTCDEAVFLDGDEVETLKDRLETINKEMTNNQNKLSKISIYTGVCTYENEKYKLEIEEENLQNIFTVIFKAPNEYIENSKIVIKEKEYEIINGKFSEGEVITVNVDNVDNKCYFKTSSAGGGYVNPFAPKDVTNFKVTMKDKSLLLTWEDGEDFVVDGACLSKWSGTKIVRKVGGYPEDITDGVLVIDNKERNKYKTEGFLDTGLTNGVEYYYMAFGYDENGGINKNEINRVSGIPKEYVIYGVCIDETNEDPESALTYINDCVGFDKAYMDFESNVFNYGSWEDKFPFNEIKPCLYKDNKVNYYLNPNDYTKKIDGNDSDIESGNDGDVMVEFPKIYWKFERIGTNLYVRYSNVKVDDGYKCLAHTKGTEEKDKIYVSAYLGSLLDDKLRSLSGKAPQGAKKIGEFRTYAQANGDNYNQMYYFPLLMLQVLYIIMFKNRDSQTALGKGNVYGSYFISTGGTNQKGLFYGENTGNKQMKFCGIEDMWGNLRYWIDGLYTDLNYHILIGNDNFNDTGNGYTDYGKGATSSISGYIKQIQGNTETGFIPKVGNGSATTNYCDNYYFFHSAWLPCFGGCYNHGLGDGMFHLYAYYSATESSATIGSRLFVM